MTKKNKKAIRVELTEEGKQIDLVKMNDILWNACAYLILWRGRFLKICEENMWRLEGFLYFKDIQKYIEDYNMQLEDYYTHIK